MRLPRGLREAGLALFAAAIVLTATFVDEGALRGLETQSLDLRFRLRGVRPPTGSVVIVSVDEHSIDQLGRWPFSRHLFADAVRDLARNHAALVVVDLLFAEADRPVPPALHDAATDASGALAGAGKADLGKRLADLASDDPDADLAAAMHDAGNVILPFAFTFTGAKGTEPDVLANAAYQNFANSPIPPVFPLNPVAALLPVPTLAAAAAGLGHVNLAYDRDGAPRYDYLALPFAGDFFPSLALRAAANFRGVPWAKVALAPGGGVVIGDAFVPTDQAMRLLINYRGPRGTFPTYSFADLIAGRVPAAVFAGKVVLLGASFIGNADANIAPFESTLLPGTERLANAIDMLLARDFIAETPSPWFTITICVVLALAAAGGAAMAFFKVRWAAFVSIAPIALWLAFLQYEFTRDLWLPAVGPTAALAAALASVSLFRYWVVDRQSRYISRAFRRYLAPEMVDILAAHPERLQLGGETRTMTMMFSDVRGFTAIAEHFKSDPQTLTHVINRFLTPMSRIIMERRGTIDKYMGDCVMAFWNAPLDDAAHADHACEAALAMVVALDEVNRGLAGEAEAAGREHLPLRIGIGINTGDCVVGNMGSDQRTDYSVLGDAVNLASRLEGQSKVYHVTIVLGETTREAAPGWAALELDRVAVKGKSEAVRLYTLMGDSALAASEAFQRLAERHDAMLEAYRAREWGRAEAALAQCRALSPALADFYDLYAARIAEYRAHPPEPEWDGVVVADFK